MSGKAAPPGAGTPEDDEHRIGTTQAGPREDAGLAGWPVYVVAADASWREALVGALRCGWAVQVFRSPAELLERLPRLEAGCIVSGLSADSPDGVLLLQELAGRGSPFPVVALAPAGDVGMAVRAMKAGATDVVAVPVDPRELRRAVQEALAGTLKSRRQAWEAEAARLRLGRLTRRERQVLDLMVRGEGNKAIAHDLAISPRTVEVHRSKVMEKLACRSLPELLVIAMQAGLLRP